MKKVNKAAAALAALVMLAGCAPAGETEKSAVPATEQQVQTEAVTQVQTPTEPVDLSKGLTDAMYSRAVLNEGNRARLAAVMKKAEAGTAITVGTIGGSITQGSAASNQQLCYAGLFNKYWTEKFPDTQVNFVNAGIGGTNSYLGVHRVDEQLLSAKPDVVVVEFSVNDADRLMNKYSYDSLVRKIMSAENEPAVILLFTTQENGTSLQETHMEIGRAYDLPCLSYREVVYPEVAAGTLDWKDISPDNIHPNDAGHSLIGQLLSRYLDSVYDERNSIEGSTAFTAEAYTADYYKNAKMLSSKDIEPVEISGFEAGTNKVYPELFPDNFVTEGEGCLKFETDCSCLGFFYLKTVDGKGGKYDVYVDGARKGVLDADFSGGWGNYGETQQILIGKESGHHEIEIKLSEGSTNTAMTILGVMVS